MQAAAAERIEREATRLQLPVSLIISRALEEVTRHLEAGWRPKKLPQAGRVYVFAYLYRARKQEADAAAKKADLTFIDVARIAVLAALEKMSGKQVLWPLIFTRRDLANAITSAK